MAKLAELTRPTVRGQRPSSSRHKSPHARVLPGADSVVRHGVMAWHVFVPVCSLSPQASHVGRLAASEFMGHQTGLACLHVDHTTYCMGITGYCSTHLPKTAHPGVEMGGRNQAAMKRDSCSSRYVWSILRMIPMLNLTCARQHLLERDGDSDSVKTRERLQTSWELPKLWKLS